MTAYLPAWLIGGVGAGLALPNLMAGSTHDLPASMAATGSGVVTSAAAEGSREMWLVAALMLVAASGAAVGMRARPTPETVIDAEAEGPIT